MSLHCFTISALASEPAQSALNAFCTQHRVLRIDRQLLADGAQSFWALCVEVANGQPPLPDRPLAGPRVAGQQTPPGSGAGTVTGTGASDAGAQPNLKQRHSLRRASV